MNEFASTVIDTDQMARFAGQEPSLFDLVGKMVQGNVEVVDRHYGRAAHEPVQVDMLEIPLRCWSQPEGQSAAAVWGNALISGGLTTDDLQAMFTDIEKDD